MIICICNEAESKEKCLNECEKGKLIKPDKIFYYEKWNKKLSKFNKKDKL